MAEGGADARFVEEHLPLIRKVATQLVRELDLSGWMDDLVAAGKAGLLEARQRFDPSRGVKLTTFAHYRIRGSMMDAIRRGGYANASVLRKIRLLQLADQQLEGIADATDAQRQAADAAAQALDQALARMSAAFIIDIVGQGQSDAPEQADVTLERAETIAQVRRVLDGLPERERAVLVAHYVEGRRFDELAAEWGISKAWMSRLHWRALDLLKDGLTEVGVTHG
ncbi:MAG: sigma-70 family RNA polymerase sigma factor [Deltaproteobacteria bacterium]|nr:sigma-70 family RNA polymerase sigma factor [Deltaproteobacteria bacterium]